MVLNFQPSANVTVTITGPSEFGPDDQQDRNWTFTTVNWETKQEVMVTAAEDDDSADYTATIAHAIKTGSATEYSTVDVDSDVSVDGGRQRHGRGFRSRRRR